MTTSHHFLTQAVRRGYVTPNPVFLSLPPSGGVASLLSSQSHIPFALLFRFQGAMKRSFTYSHWERANSNPDFEKISSLIPTGSSQMHTLNGKNILNLKSPLTYLELRSRNAPCFLKKSSKIFLECSAGKKRKRMVLRIRFQIGTLPGRFSPFFLPCKAFSKGGQGKDTFLPVSPKCAFQGIKKAPVFLLEICLKTDAMLFAIQL